MPDQQPEPSPDEVRAAAGLANSSVIALRMVQSILAGDREAVQADTTRIDQRGWGTGIAVACCGLLANLLKKAEEKGWLGDMTATEWAGGAAMRQLDESIDIEKRFGEQP